MESKRIAVALTGNPNSGKTSIFNNLTGARQHVANYPGVTVERKEGRLSRDGHEMVVVDLPGTYSLSPYSVEEVVVRDFIVHEEPDVVVDVVDASNLERNLYLAAQLIDLHCKLVICLNMVDVATENKILIDQKMLSTLLGAPVVQTNGRLNRGTEDLLDAIFRVAEDADSHTRHIHINYGREIEEELAKLEQRVEAEKTLAERYHPRWLAVKLLEADSDIVERLRSQSDVAESLLGQARKSRRHLEKIYGEDIETIVADRIYSFLNGLCREVVNDAQRAKTTRSDRIDKVLTNRMFGLPIFALLMWLMFEATFTLGEPPMRWIESFFGLLGTGVGRIMPEGILKDLIVTGMIDGVGGVLVFLPNILILFFFLAMLEDSGYMARAAFLMDKVMHLVGLHGKSFIALLTGVGCNAPAVMATRTLESQEDRLITILISPLISCSARYPVYVLFTGAFFAERQGMIVFILYMLGALLAMGMAYIFRKVLFKGRSSPFVLELPPYRIPTFRSVVIHMWERGSIFLRKAGTIILAGVVLVWVLQAFPRNVTLSRDYAGEISAVRQRTEAELGELRASFEEAQRDRRQTYTDAFIPFEESAAYQEIESYYDDARRELNDSSANEIRVLERGRLGEQARGRFAGRIGTAMEPLIRPLGFDWRLGISMIPGFVAKEVVVGSLGVLLGAGDETEDAEHGALRDRLTEHYTPLVGFCFMVFTLIYTPCLATVAVIRKETNSWRWALFSIAYSVVLAWIVTFAIYQCGLLLGLGGAT